MQLFHLSLLLDGFITRPLENMSHKMRMALALSALGLLLVEKEERQRRRRKRIRRNRTKWVQSWILQRQAQAVSPTQCRELEFSETSDFKDFARLFPVQFHALKELISPLIRRQNTNYRDCISVEERLTVTLWYLATGNTLFVVLSSNRIRGIVNHDPIFPC